MMAEFPALPLWTDAYISDTRHLSQAEHGAYLLLLVTAWRTRDCSLPDDDKLLARYAGCDKRTWLRQKPTIMAFWSLSEGRWTQKRLSKERAYVAELNSKRAEAGRLSLLVRSSSKQLENNNTGSANRITNGQQNVNTHTHTISKKEDSVAIATGVETPSNDPVKDLWDRGLSILGSAQRSVLGKMRKRFGDVIVLEAICACEAEQPSDPVPYFLRCCETHSAPKPKMTPATTLFEGAFNAARKYDQKHGIGRDDRNPDDPLLDSGRAPALT